MDAKGAPLTRNLCFGLHLQLRIQALFVVSDNKSGSKLHSELKQICTCGRHMPDECRIFSAREGKGEVGKNMIFLEVKAYLAPSLLNV